MAEAQAESAVGGAAFSFPKTILVDVTQEDIDGGVQHDVRRCPQALAFQREITKILPGAIASVGVQSATVWKDENRIEVIAWYSLSGAAETFVNKFDETFATTRDGNLVTVTSDPKTRVKPARFRYTLED